MDDAALQERLRRIERRQYLLVVLLGIPYLYAIADHVGFAVAGVLYAAIGIVTVGATIGYRRRKRGGLQN
jgi:hypothetical protein